MAKSRITFSTRFPYAGLFLLIAVVVAIPLTVWSLDHKTNVTQLAAKGTHGGGKPTTGSSSLSVLMVADNNNDGLPNWNDTITFNVVTDQTQLPTVSLKCYKNNVLVLGDSAGFYDSYPWPGSRNMPLVTPVWQSGGADCIAGIINYSKNNGVTIYYTSINFHVNP